MYKFLIPLFALALLIGCTKQAVPAPDALPSDTTGVSSMAATASAGAVSSVPMTPPPTTATDAPISFDGQTLTGKHVIVLKTSKGDVTLELDGDAAPKTVTNFLVLAKAGYYNGLTFHRVIPDFMIQGGDPSGDGTGGVSIYGETFEDEPNDLKMVHGALAMANRGPNTNGSQFFIVQAAETPWLQGRHTVFGHVTAGLDVVDAIAHADRDDRDRPLKPITYTVEVKS